MAVSNGTKILLLCCGSFNPITFMHLRMFEIARDALWKNKQHSVIRGIISPVHDAYGKKGLVSSTHRLTMARLATETSDLVKVDDWECTQSGWSETVKVLNHAKECLLNNSTLYSSENTDPREVKIKLLCGGDLLESFAVPDLWSEQDIKTIVGDFGLVVISRKGSSPHKFVEGSDILRKLKDNIDIIEPWMPNDMSATIIRQILKKGESIRYLTHDAVVKYIKSNKLYI